LYEGYVRVEREAPRALLNFMFRENDIFTFRVILCIYSVYPVALTPSKNEE